MLRVTTIVALLAGLHVPAARAGEIFMFSHESGLAAVAEFSLLNQTTLEVRLQNTSTGAPVTFAAADQLLTGVSWDFGQPGNTSGDPRISGGAVRIGTTSHALDFDAGAFGPGADVSGEFGYGNAGGSGMLTNFISATGARATRFSGANLDGPLALNGPQGGLAALPAVLPLGGLGAIQNEVVATLTLTKPVTSLSFLQANSVRVEFGSDAKFITVPEPVVLAALLAPSLIWLRRWAIR
ncbi:MAG: hypothetical protein LC135_17265 [Phycisphaerae bacterium]|nr:hypothetical protein [Phycisphaerae bacterium]MCZ2401590.1 hypothetical protein [Phycisphaerae bacterium]NUQ50903.1 hypothetical protein [Phycisphaerae bacterium]